MRFKEALSFFEKKETKKLLSFGVLAFFILALSGAGEDPVVAERGADRITVSQAKSLALAADPRLLQDPAALKRFLTNVLVQRALFEQAHSDHWQDRPDVAALIARAQDQVIAQSYLVAHAALPAGYPSDADIQAAYEQNKAKLMQPRHYHLAQIYLAKTPSFSEQDARRKLVTLRAQLRGRAKFEDLARANYADLGWLPENQLLPEVKAEVSGLPEGSVSQPLCTSTGCHLIKLIATRPAGPAPLADARDALVRALRQQKQSALENDFASSLLAKQPVAINEIELKRIAP